MRPKKYSKTPTGAAVLKTWDTLNKAIITADEALCRKLLAAEKAGRSRAEFLTRIHSRLNRMRRERERRELVK